MNALDRLISVFSPESGLRRARARTLLSIAGRQGFRRQAAVSGNNRAMASNVLDHPDSSGNHSDRVTLMREARDLEENNAVIASILRKFITFAVARLYYIPRTSNEAANKAISTYVERWMQVADWTGRHSFRTLAGLAITHTKRDGDIGFIVHEEKIKEPKAGEFAALDKTSPIRLQAIEADRIGAIWNTSQHGAPPFKALKANECDFSGVIVDKNGRPVRYRIFNRQKGGASFVPWGEVAAQDFLHVFDPIRVDGYRGFSAFSSSINDIKDLHELLGLEKIGVKRLTNWSGFVNNSDGTSDGDVSLDDAHDSYNADGDRIESIQPGSIKYLKVGESFTPLEFDRPSPTFNGFLETLIRLTALSVGMPFGQAYMWPSQGTAVRMEAAQAQREFEQTQLMLEEKLLNPIVRRVIAHGIKLGHLPAVADFDAGEWRYPAKVTADVGRESKADVEEVRMGLRSKTQVNADRGEDHQIVRGFTKREQLDVIADAKELVAASGGEIDLKTAIWMLEKSAPNPPMTPPEPEPAEEEPAPKKQANEAPIAPLTFNFPADIKANGKRKSVIFDRGKDGVLLGAEIIEEDDHD